MDLLPGFAWPVPRAFASAVSAGRFEQGDVFYDDPRGYGAWTGKARAKRWVQVLDPPRTARSAPTDAEGNRFAANWVSPVSVEVGRPGERATETFRSTQGRLFSCLWRGLPGLLEEGGEDPPMPSGARELQKQLDATVDALRDALGDGVRLFFASVVDESSEASLAKCRAVESAVATKHAVTTVSLAPAAAGVPDGAGYHPALRVQAVGITAADEASLRELLKRALYAPTRAAAESGADRFKLERHGLLIGPRAPVAAPRAPLDEAG